MFNSFPCNSCGLCCKNIGHIYELKSYDRGDGVCRYLERNLCSNYEERPLICRIDKMYDHVYHQSFSKEEYYTLNLKACKKLQVENGLSEKDQLDLHILLGGHQ